jgi:putative oxidoreductase
MMALITLHNRLFTKLEKLSPLLLPTLARLVFAGVLCGYFWTSARTKLGDGLFGVSDGAYAQIFPRAFEAVGFDAGQLGLWHWFVVLAGTCAEFLLPLLIVAGLLTRLSALGMIGFIFIQSLTDVFGHGATGDTVGRWFDRAPDALILDQRAFWIFLLVILVLKGAGPISADRALRQRASG